MKQNSDLLILLHIQIHLIQAAVGANSGDLAHAGCCQYERGRMVGSPHLGVTEVGKPRYRNGHS
jgi:hypothetical protein